MFILGNAKDELQKLHDIQLVITSPPYWQQRQYNDLKACKLNTKHTKSDELGNESSVFDYIRNLAEIFGNGKYLKSDGSLVIVIGDAITKTKQVDPLNVFPTIYPKEQCDIIGMLIQLLRINGFLLRQRIVWAKPNALPNTYKSRFNSSHEYMLWFTITDKPKFYPKNVRIPSNTPVGKKINFANKKYNQKDNTVVSDGKRSIQDVVICPNQCIRTVHPAPFTPVIPSLWINACTDKHDLVVDPFHGSGTTQGVAEKLHRKYIGIDIREY